MNTVNDLIGEQYNFDIHMYHLRGLLDDMTTYSIFLFFTAILKHVREVLSAARCAPENCSF